jgi:hypothetical protein
MMELLTSTEWQRNENETEDIFTVRKATQLNTWQQMKRKRGNCYLVKFGNNDIRPMWEDQIDSKKLVEMVQSPTSIPLDCPLCQPYDYFDTTIGQYKYRRFMAKVVNPKYPEGFIDKEGVWMKCPCLKKGPERKNLKFLSTRT